MGFCPRLRITVPSSLVVMVPSPSLSNRENASLNSAIRGGCGGGGDGGGVGGGGGSGGGIIRIMYVHCTTYNVLLPIYTLYIPVGSVTAPHLYIMQSSASIRIYSARVQLKWGWVRGAAILHPLTPMFIGLLG